MDVRKKIIDRIQPLSNRTAKSSSDLLSDFKSAQIADALVKQAQLPVVREFHLGDKLLSYCPSLSNETYFDGHSFASGCYLISTGYVRLLCQNIHLQRQVSVDLLSAGAVIGADRLFCLMPLSYQAVAASHCHLIQIPYLQLNTQLERSPQLREHLSQTAQQRERLIFFKRFTQQRFRSSRILKHLLLPNLIEQRVYAGEYLYQALPDTGYFWLRAGQVLSQSNRSKEPTVGDSWGYPDAVPEDWVAQTDLVVYKLPLDSCKTLDLLYL
ncbi:MAG: hypothetical protein Kow00121_01260 [Elainellaceae cyanobacterium]